MKRNQFLLKGIDKSMLGLEVAPWFNPIVAKADGYNVRTLDVFDFDTLMERAKGDPEIDARGYDKLEAVDYVGSATEVLSLVPAEQHGTFDYVVSSHNFEHLPNPIKFLQGCEALLSEGGSLVMALPDGRACFDYFRPHTVTADWLEAFVEDRKQPSERQLFAGHTDLAYAKGKPDRGAAAVSFSTLRTEIENRNSLAEKWSEWQERKGKGDYIDSHCTVMTPASFQLLIEDCVALGLISFNIDEVSPTNGVEFLVRLTKRKDHKSADADDYPARRTRLLHAVWDEQAVRQGAKRYGNAATAEFYLNFAAGLSVVQRLKMAIRLANKKRIARRRSRAD
ncbi:methyltransferase domain-containing protein [uncultured Tateyamaria sp.]|uniref:methyltransferase domain-containing protein n=1 Tax=uncultured Tateyamaria sp. TaxID=455651 RepID=UPI00260C015D|nr:methyltransferase domain-containing protein [uncultured Tateyamaria sp.]